VDELNNIPAENIEFRPAPGARSVAELIRHIVQAQKIVVGELCRVDTKLAAGRPAELVRQYAAGIAAANDKRSLLALLQDSMQEAEATIRAFGESNLNEPHRGFDGKRIPKIEVLRLYVGHEMYHRGQITVYQRLLGIEPAFTAKLNARRSATPNSVD
jgi:uncharacterized damage-inducible protein DinB